VHTADIDALRPKIAAERRMFRLVVASICLVMIGTRSVKLAMDVTISG